VVKVLPILALLVMVGCGNKEGALHGASMNFDLENVEPFLTRLNTNLAAR
jgi:hypothetical protein